MIGTIAGVAVARELCDVTGVGDFIQIERALRMISPDFDFPSPRALDLHTDCIFFHQFATWMCMRRIDKTIAGTFAVWCGHDLDVALDTCINRWMKQGGCRGHFTELFYAGKGYESVSLSQPLVFIFIST